ncbi:MAG: prolyl oligopeptidase family serine peptidase [Pseudomonadota bacterium]|nr:prolyl oligopeptidase family serine peptidase [Pseudomonadota bacterium]
MKKMLSLVIAAALGTSLSACVSTAADPVTSSTPVPVTAPPAVVTPETVTQPVSSDTITLKQIMADPQWMGRSPVRPGWSLDGSMLVYEQERENSHLRDVFAAPVNMPANAERIPLSEQYLYRYSEKAQSVDGQTMAFLAGESVFIKHKSQPAEQLIRGGAPVHGLSFMTDGRLMVTTGNRVVAIDVNNGRREQLFSWAFGDKPEAVSEPEDYIAGEQIKLIKYIDKKRRQSQQSADRNEKLKTVSPAYVQDKVWFDKGDRLVTASVSPNGKFALVVTTADVKSRDDSDIMPHFIQEDARILPMRVRSRVADAEPVNHDAWLVNLQTGEKSKLSYMSLPGYNDDVLADVKSENAAARGDKYVVNRLPRDITLFSSWDRNNPSVRWHKNGGALALMLEAWDNKDRWIVTVDFEKGRFETQERLHDDAWVNYSHNQFGWLNNSETLFYQSEKDGYSHLYLQVPGENPQQLTRGQFVTEKPALTSDDKFIYYQANKKHPGIYEVYRVNTATGASEAMTDLNGITDFVLSPDNNTLLLTHSKVNRPPELYIKKAGDSGAAQKITDTVSDAFLSMPWAVPQVVAMPSSHTSQPVYARVYLPEGYNEGEKRKAVVFNHGAGYLQNAHLGWSGYFREYMFNSMLVQQGYVVMDMDYRASKGYGRDWRTAIYRQMGTPEVEDLRDGVNWLTENANVDPARIGTYGGSYGGFLTFMSMFTAPDLFAAGAALRPVTDWAHYNAPYTSNILNTPDVDPIAFERSSPIYFAEGLEKPLLIIAPMVDDNVFFQDSVRLVQRLIELEKTDFETAIYPVEPHGFVQPSSWLDEYRRIYKLFDTNL